MKMSTKNLLFNSAVIDFDVNKRNLKPEQEELIKCSREEDNTYDIFSMKVCKSGTDEVVGHLPMEKDRITKFIMDRWASATLSVK